MSPKKYFSRNAGNIVHLSSHHETADSRPVPVNVTTTDFIHNMLTTKYKSNIPTKETTFLPKLPPLGQQQNSGCA